MPTDTPCPVAGAGDGGLPVGVMLAAGAADAAVPGAMVWGAACCGMWEVAAAEVVCAGTTEAGAAVVVRACFMVLSRRGVAAVDCAATGVATYTLATSTSPSRVRGNDIEQTPVE